MLLLLTHGRRIQQNNMGPGLAEKDAAKVNTNNYQTLFNEDLITTIDLPSFYFMVVEKQYNYLRSIYL